MPLSSDFQSVFRGDTPVIEIYLGDSLIWPTGIKWTRSGGFVYSGEDQIIFTDDDVVYGTGAVMIYRGFSGTWELEESTTLGAPTSLDATADDGEVALTWVAPAIDGGSAITDYVIRYRTTAGPGSWNTFSDGTSTTPSTTVTGLTNDTSYDFEVAAVNAIGQGPWSTTVTATPEGGSGVLAIDNFNRANGALGSNWLGPIRDSNWQQLVIVDNEVSGSQGYNVTYVWNTPASSTDQYSEMDFWGQTGEEYLIICCPAGSGTNAALGYRVIFYQWGDFVSLEKNGTQVASFDRPGSGDAVYYRFRLQRSGNVISVYEDDVLLGTWTDPSAQLTGLYFGFGSQSSNNGDPRMNNYEGGDL